jgi:dephospho-CoA kinase
MLKVGLTGGYASGKSFVARRLNELGCHLLYADRLGHAVLEPSGEAYAPTLAAFGPEILTSESLIDRKKLASIVFSSPERLAQLNSFVHPAVFHLEEQTLAEWRRQDPNGIAVIEAAILIETGRYKVFDRMILTACDQETQIARGMERDHLTREEVLARLSRQMPLEQKRAFAHYVVDTGGPKEETARQVEVVFRDLQRLAQVSSR